MLCCLLESLLNSAAPWPSARPQFRNLVGESDAKHAARLQVARADAHDFQAFHTRTEREQTGF